MDPIERKKSILEAAKRVFARKGYHATGVADIIAEAGIARGTFYLYFNSKRDVFQALMEYIIQCIDEAVPSLPVDEPEKILPTIKSSIIKVYEMFTADPDLAAIIMREAISVDADSQDRIAEIKQMLVKRMVHYIKEGQRHGIICDVEPEILAYAFIGSVGELFEQHVITGFVHADEEEVIDNLLQMYLFGIISPDFKNRVRSSYEQRR